MRVSEFADGIRSALWFLAGRIMSGVVVGFIIACLIGSPDTFLGVWAITGTLFAMFGKYWLK
ncbi:hypothetical protein [Aeromonas veronii]|uniref:Uncharacterized protein n=1 Tax=Aeromonas veronii TaxID=654 RepID=A0AAW5MLL7_AERVE|nr:hypothetical protein [Aeromonas veronii]MCR4450657.1 hypothetical protein [Aeromonas veronii]